MTNKECVQVIFTHYNIEHCGVRINTSDLTSFSKHNPTPFDRQWLQEIVLLKIIQKTQILIVGAFVRAERALQTAATTATFTGVSTRLKQLFLLLLHAALENAELL